MSFGRQGVVFLLGIAILARCAQNTKAGVKSENGLKSKVYLSPKIPLYPGSVSNKYYYDVDFPKGHIAVKSFYAEVVDEAGNPISLKETYLHHWLAVRYHEPKGVNDHNDIIMARNAGTCEHALAQFFGLGSETRQTATYIPDPYGIELGNPLEIPSGYDEKWYMIVHAIDTRGAVDAKGCTECRCNLYNVTNDEDGEPLDPTYVGGLHCCYDGTQCEVENGFPNVTRNLYLRYNVTWVDWSDSIIPVKVFILDVTDAWPNTGTHYCNLEYDVQQSTSGIATNDYIDSKRTKVNFPISGDVIYSVGHQHSGGVDSTIYGEDGRVICTSKPIYGNGNEAGNEDGYVVGMTTCYPEPGSVKIAKGEIITLESNYTNEKLNTGVMGLFYLYVADSDLNLNEPVQGHEDLKVSIFLWGLAVFGLAICVAALVSYQRRKQSEDGYQSIPA